MKPLIYLASPYTHPDPIVEHERFLRAATAAAELIKQQFIVISPIAHAHPIKENARGSLGGDWSTWSALDMRLLSICDIFAILTISGWDVSHGIAEELAIAKASLKTIMYLNPVTYSLEVVP